MPSLVRVGYGFESHAAQTRNGRVSTFCGLPRKGQRVHGIKDGSLSCLRCRRALIARGISLA